jgi:hypothetical protein
MKFWIRFGSQRLQDESELETAAKEAEREIFAQEFAERLRLRLERAVENADRSMAGFPPLPLLPKHPWYI